MFDLDDFLVRCQEANAETEPRRAIREVLARALSQPISPIEWTEADEQATEPVVHPSVGGEGPAVRH